MSKFITAARKFIVAEEGASLVEYGLLCALIAVVCIGAMQALGTSINNIFGYTSTALNSASSSS